MKKKLFLILLLILIGIILYVSFKFTKMDDNVSKVVDITKTEIINDKTLNVTYVGGNMIDVDLNYGYTYEKEISIENKNNSAITYSLILNEKEISNDLVTYAVNATVNDQEVLNEISDYKKIDGNTLLYDLSVDANSKIKLIVYFKSNKEEVVTSIKGIIAITSNLSEKEIFIENIKKINELLNEKIDKLNGISTPGYYTIDASLLNNNFKGTILIDATDISELEYYYSVSSGNYMINDYNYKGELLKNSVISNENLMSAKELCNTHSKKECSDFSTIPYNESGGKKKFLNDSKVILNSVKEVFNKSDKKVYIYDVSQDIENNTNIRGYILINNTLDVPEYYLYLTNNIFMISGYNYSKYGDYSDNSGTIRAYKESAFNLSSENISKVCSFSGFSDCYNIREEKV